MRQYLAMQAMESGKGFSRNFIGDRSRISAYGNGQVLMTPEPSPQGKIGKPRDKRACWTRLTGNSHPSLQLPIAEHRLLAPRGPECDGSSHILLA